MDCLRTAHRATEAARRFLTQASRRHGLPETISIDSSEANEAAIKRDNEAPGPPIISRPVKYVPTIVAQDHRAVQRVTRSMRGCNAFDAAQATLAGVERRHRLKKRQRMVEAGDEELTAAKQFDALAS